jgi:hypothetical protein
MKFITPHGDSGADRTRSGSHARDPSGVRTAFHGMVEW